VARVEQLMAGDELIGMGLEVLEFDPSLTSPYQFIGAGHYCPVPDLSTHEVKDFRKLSQLEIS